MARKRNINDQTPAIAAGQPALPLVESANEHLDIGALETWLWDAACAIRGATVTDEGITAVVEVYKQWVTQEKLSKVITLEEARAADYNLSPSQFVEVGERVSHRSLSSILEDLAVARVERERADAELHEVLAKLRLEA